MIKKINTSNTDNFNIWFNREKRKEFYTASTIMYNTTFNYNSNSKLHNIVLKSKESYNSSKDENIYFSTCNFDNPFEDNYGTFLIRFINANFLSFETGYFTFFCFYGFSILEEFYENVPKPKLFNSANEFINTYQPVFDIVKFKLKRLQSQIRKCVDYMYNLNQNFKYKDYSSLEKYITYAISKNLFKHTTNIEIYSFKLFAYGKLNIDSKSITPKILREYLDNGMIDINNSVVFCTSYLSNILYISLREIASNESVIVKICKNCGKYFIPVKTTEKYCDIIYYQNEQTCKMNGANNSYSKKRKSIEGIKFYRNNYQRRLMQIKRSDNEQIKLAFGIWKELARIKIKEFNNNEISENELLEWMKKNRDI